jgi:hypothetical protein
MITLNFKKWNTILGWSVFAIALIVYTLTVEPTLSFWDAGEYIATSAKLEVGHPPGAPLFQMIGAFFAMFAFGDPTKVALMTNMVSVFSSAFTILFLFWSITIILRDILIKYSEFNNNNAVVVLGGAFVGSLAFTFSDSFWFNAVETEVYAMASLFIAIMLWLGLRWGEEMHTPRGNRWLLIIALMTGLSFGVHFMALLTIPTIGFIYFFKNYEKVTIKNFVIANVVIIAILLFIFKLLLPYTLALFGKTEIFMVNSFGLPFNSGTIFITLVIIAFFYYSLQYTKRKQLPFYNTVLLCVLFIFIGFSTWVMLPIRANANVVINENRPSDAAEVLAYYNREQYGEQKLFYGPMFSDAYAGLDKENPYEDEKPNYQRDYKTGKYVIVNKYEKAKQNTDDNHKGFMPRMWSTEHAANYMRFSKPLDFRIDPNYDWERELQRYGLPLEQMSEEEVMAAMGEVKGRLEQAIGQFRADYSEGGDPEDYDKFLKQYGQYLVIDRPSLGDNLSFMLEYQFGYMYWRYLMWNFTGRQSDLQGKYDNMDGNWLSGIKFIDEMHLGSQDNLPSDSLNNKGRNTYYFLPLILGLLGLAFHARKDPKSFYILLSLFLFTGLALKIYLNERPFEPRERDYALVGSFYVFAMWIALGVYAIYDGIKKFLQPKIAGPVVIAVSLLAAPVLMGAQNWDDHDRSDKYTARAMAMAYLASCEPNAILFTIGDNDTFPLWYMQEVEGFRTDVRIVNTSLFMTDWYIDQMKAKAYESEPMPISFKREQYQQGTRDYMIYDPQVESRWNIKDFIAFLASEDERTKLELNNGHKVNFYPTNKIRVPVNKQSIIANKVVSPSLYDSIVPYIDIDIKGDALYKNRLMMLDIIANNNWKRPVYFTGGSFGDDDYLWMKEYLQLDGMVYKLIPVKTPIPEDGSPLDMGHIDTDKMYDIVMKWDWGNSEDPNIYHDPETRKNSITYRTNLARLMEALINEGKKDKARKIIDLAMTKMPLEYYNFYTLVEPFASGYYELGEKGKARDILTKLSKKYQENLDYYKGLSPSEQNDIHVDIITDIERYRSLLLIMKDRGDLESYNKAKPAFNRYNNMYERFGRDNE